MDLLIPVNLISVRKESINLAIHNIKEKHLILNICGIRTLNIYDEKHINLVMYDEISPRLQSNGSLRDPKGGSAVHPAADPPGGPLLGGPSPAPGVYCMIHDAKNFSLDDLKCANVLIAREYFKICSFAFLLGVGKDCFLKNDKLFMYNVNDQKVDNIVPNILCFLSPREVMEIVDDVYKTLDLFEKYNLISNDVKLIMKDKYQTQVINDMF